MNTDRNAGDEMNPADALLERRLTQRFAAQLAQAERDYPTLGIGRAAAARPASPGTRRSGGQLGRLAAVVVGFGVLAVVAVSFLGRGATTGPALGGPSASAPGPAIPADTMPATIDGQPVLSINSMGDARSGTFYLHAFVRMMAIPCPAPLQTPSTEVEIALVPDCGGVFLVPQPSGNTSAFIDIAPKSIELLTPWLNGPEIVLRAHRGDAAASQCSATFREQCESALVGEAVVWPTTEPIGTYAPPPSTPYPSEPSSPNPVTTVDVGPGKTMPTEIDGQPVRRLDPPPTWPMGPFYVRAYVVTRAIPCPTNQQLPSTGPEKDLIGGCGGLGLQSADGSPAFFGIAPKSVGLLTPWVNTRAVVLRVRVDDPEASLCSAAYRSQCRGALVVEAVVWPAAPEPIASGSLTPFPLVPPSGAPPLPTPSPAPAIPSAAPSV